MPKATLTWDLDEPDDYDDFKKAVNARNMSSALFDFGQYIRTQIKWGENSESEYELLEKVRDQFNQILADNGVDAMEL